MVYRMNRKHKSKLKKQAKRLRRKAFLVCQRKLGTLETDYIQIAKRIAFDLGQDHKNISISRTDKLLSHYSGIQIHKSLEFSRKKQKPKSFYESDEWRALRIEAFNIHGYKCLKCGAEPPIELHVDHIKPRSLYPKLELDIDNLQILCKNCNLKKSNKHCTDYRSKTYSDYVDEALDLELLAKNSIYR